MTIMRHEIEEAIPVAERLIARASEIAKIGAALADRKPAVIMVVGRGTSDHAAIFARYVFEYALGVPVALGAASILTQYGVQSANKNVALIAFSQSGAGPDIIAMTEGARAAGALTIAVTNEPTSPLARAAEHLVDLGAGEERAVAATKTYLAELVAIVLMAAGAARAAGRSVEWAEHVAEIPNEMRAALKATDSWIAADYASGAVHAMRTATRVLIATRGFEYPNALEFALKLRETTGVFADGYSAADLLHGPIASAGSETPAVLIETDPATAPSLPKVAERLRSAGVPLLRIVTSGAPSADLLPLPISGGLLSVPATGIAILALVESTAVARGQNPDAPAGLSKVTKTL